MRLEAYGRRGAKKIDLLHEADALLVAHEDDDLFSLTVEQRGEQLCADVFPVGRGIVLKAHRGCRLVVTANHDGSLAVRAVEEK